MTNPTVTVLMSMYNESSFVVDTVNSILNQMWEDFEFIIIDDCSIDNSVELVSSIPDKRIKLFSNTSNLGICKSLQRGVSLAIGKYIARIDADDIAKPERLAKQVNFLNANPDVGIVGSSCLLFGAEVDDYGLYQVPYTDLKIRWTSLLNNPFASSSIMLRKQTIVENALNYDSNFRVAEDFELWTRLLSKTKGFNFSIPLVKYRLRDGLTQKHRDEMLKNHDFIAHRTIRSTLPDFPITPEQVTKMRSLLITENYVDETGTLRIAELEDAIAIYLAMLSAFLDTHATHPEKNSLKWQEIYKISRLLLRLSKRAGIVSGFKAILAPHLGQLTRLSWR